MYIPFWLTMILCVVCLFIGNYIGWKEAIKHLDEEDDRYSDNNEEAFNIKKKKPMIIVKKKKR